MGKATIVISEEFLKDFLDLPQGWTLTYALIHTHKLQGDERRDLELMVTGESIEESDKPLVLTGKFESRSFANEEGRWTQGHWEIYRRDRP